MKLEEVGQRGRTPVYCKMTVCDSPLPVLSVAADVLLLLVGRPAGQEEIKVEALLLYQCSTFTDC